MPTQIDFSKYGTPITTTKSGVDFSKYGTLSTTQPTVEEQPEPKDSFLGNLVKAPLTIAARGPQAIAELLGASSEDVNKFTSKIPLIGKAIAPVPENFADVKKDIGRGAQTVAFGLNPVAGGALFGAGNSLEQGNDLFSAQTAFQTVLGAGAGKVLDLVGKPLLDVAGKVVGKITPSILKDVAGKGAGAIADFAAQHEIFPEAIGKGINTAAKNAEIIANKPFELAGKATRAILPKPENIMNRVARLTPSEANKFKELTGMSHGEYLTQTGNFGKPEDIVKNEFAKFQASKLEADKGFAQIPGNFREAPIKNAIDDLLAREERIGISGNESARIKELANKYETDGLTMDETNEVKRLYERNVRLNYAKDIRANPDVVERANRVDSDLRNWQFREAENRGFKNLSAINKQTQASKFIIDKLGKQLTGKAGNELIPLSDLIILSGGNIQNIVGYLAKRGLGSKTFQAKLASILNSKEVQPFITAELGQSKILGLPAPKVYEMGGAKSPTTFEAPAQQIRQSSVQELYLPAPTSNAQGLPIQLPTSIRESNLGLDEIRNMRNQRGLNQPISPQTTTNTKITNINRTLPRPKPKSKLSK